MLPDIIEVIILPQVFTENKYESQTDCYLANALNAYGFDNVQVKGFGITYIEGKLYYARNTFLGDDLRQAFSKNESLKVILDKIN